MDRKINSDFDRKVIAVLRNIVPGQEMSLTDVDKVNWTSAAIDDNNAALTTIKKNGVVVVRILYDYETGEEKEMIF